MRPNPFFYPAMSWLMLFTLLYAFDRVIPWWVWVFAVLDAVWCAIHAFTLILNLFSEEPS